MMANRSEVEVVVILGSDIFETTVEVCTQLWLVVLNLAQVILIARNPHITHILLE